MRIAIPLANGKLALHFGHCETFALIDADESTHEQRSVTEMSPPPHQPGVLPRWLAQQGAGVIIAGGMGSRAQALFAENGIKVVVGAPAEEPATLVERYLNGTLETGGNVCAH